MYVEHLYITNLYDYLSNTGHDQIKIAAYKVPSGPIAREKSAELAGYSAEFFLGEDKRVWYIFTKLSQEDKPKAYTVKPVLNLQITNDDIDTIMSSAIESGGISNWCKSVEVVDEQLGEFPCEQISKGGTLLFQYFDENDNFTSKHFTLDMLLNGIKIAAEKGYIKDTICFDPLTIGDIDAIFADKVIQCAVLGDLIFD